MTGRYADLRAALDAGPTPGPWGARAGGLDCGLATDCAVHTWERCIAQIVDNPLNRRDATFIAAANPDTIRALLSDYDRMRAALQREAVYHEGQEKAHRIWAKNTNGVYDALKAEWHKERAQQIRAALAQEGS